MYQLTTSNGHILENFINCVRLRKLNEDERKRYFGNFWAASTRLKLHDRRARDQKELQEFDVQLKRLPSRISKRKNLANWLPLKQSRKSAPNAANWNISSNLRLMPLRALHLFLSPQNLANAFVAYLHAFVMAEYLFYFIIRFDSWITERRALFGKKE